MLCHERLGRLLSASLRNSIRTNSWTKGSQRLKGTGRNQLLNILSLRMMNAGREQIIISFVICIISSTIAVIMLVEMPYQSEPTGHFFHLYPLFQPPKLNLFPSQVHKNFNFFSKKKKNVTHDSNSLTLKHLHCF